MWNFTSVPWEGVCGAISAFCTSWDTPKEREGGEKTKGWREGGRKRERKREVEQGREECGGGL